MERYLAASVNCRGVHFQFAIDEHIFAGRQIGGQTVGALNVGHELDLGDFKRAQINLRDPSVGLVVDPKPVAIVAAVSLAQYRMMGVAPERAGSRKALVSIRTGIVGIAKAGAAVRRSGISLMNLQDGMP